MMKFRKRPGTEQSSPRSEGISSDDIDNSHRIIGDVDEDSARLKTEKKLHEAELRYRSLFEQSPDGIAIFDLETGLPIEFNDVACEQLSYTRDEFAQLRVTDFETAIGDAGEYIEGILKRGQDTFETEVRTKKGDLRSMLVSVRVIELSERKALYSVARDITALKKAEAERTDAVDQSRRLWEESNALLSATRAVLEYNNFPQAARSIFDSSKDLIGATSGYVALLNEDGTDNEVLFLDPGGLSCSVDPGLPMPIRGLRGDAYGSGEPVYENDFPNSGYVEFMPDGHVHLKNVLFAPLMLDKKAVGLLGYANKPGGFTGNDLSLASSFADLASVALSNSRAYYSLKKSEERFRSVTQSANEAVISADGSGKIISWNRGAQRIFGYREDEMLGQSLDKIMPERYRGGHSRGLNRLRDTGQSRLIGDTIEMHGLRKDGSEFPVELSLSTWKTDHDVFFGSIIRDISERKKNEEMLRVVSDEADLHRRETEVVLENTPEAHLAYLDRDFNFIMVNATYVKGSGKLSKGELIGHNHFDLFPSDENKEIFERVRDTGEAIKLTEKPFEFPDQPERGTTYWDWTLTPVKKESGETSSLVLSLVDVTEKVKSRQYNEALNTINNTINSTLAVEQIIPRVMQEAAEVLGADSMTLYFREGNLWQAGHTFGENTPKTGQKLSTDESQAVWRILATKKPVSINDTSEDTSGDPLVRKEINRSFLAVPLLRKSQVTGIVTFEFSGHRIEINRARLDFCEKLAISISLAFENARLFQFEQESRAEIQNYATQLSLLHEIGLSLNQETDRDKLLESVLKIAAEMTSAGVGAILLVKNGMTDLISLYYAPWYENRCTITDDASNLHRRVGQLMGDSTKNAIRIPGLSDADPVIGLPAGHPHLRGLLVGKLMDTRGRTRGYFLLSDKASGLDFTPEDEQMISLLASQSSVALVSAENFEREHVVAETLQSSLLPDIPEHDRIEVGLIYRSASSVGKIGGDFYDFIELDGNRVALAVGDVCGKGLTAATYTAMVKFTLRAYLEDGLPPGECLSKLNSVICKNIAPEKFITLSLAILDLDGNNLSYSIAGHPEPILAVNGHPFELKIPNTLPLGVVDRFSFPSHDTHVAEDMCMLMYTDGALEAKSRAGELYGLTRLRQAFSDILHLPCQSITQNLAEEITDFSEKRLNDDLALMVIRPR